MASMILATGMLRAPKAACLFGFVESGFGAQGLYGSAAKCCLKFDLYCWIPPVGDILIRLIESYPLHGLSTSGNHRLSVSRFTTSVLRDLWVILGEASLRISVAGSK